MGELMRAVCECGLEDECHVGCGMWRVSYFPYSCPRCRRVVDVETREATPRCPECRSEAVVSFAEPHMAEPPAPPPPADAWEAHQAAEERLTTAAFRCPRCGKPTLRFRLAGMWD